MPIQVVERAVEQVKDQVRVTTDRDLASRNSAVDDQATLATQGVDESLPPGAGQARIGLHLGDLRRPCPSAGIAVLAAAVSSALGSPTRAGALEILVREGARS